jgi:chromosome segregation ATPase
MNNEKFINVYIDILQNTLNEWLLQNVSLQAKNKVVEDSLKEQAETIQNLQIMVANSNEELEKVKQDKDSSQLARIQNLENALKDHLDTIAKLNVIKNEYESIRNQVNHVDTFRNELIKEREEHQKTRNEYDLKVKELSDQIEYLQLTPAKRKKVDDEKNKLAQVEIVSTLPIDDTIKDGGSF